MYLTHKYIQQNNMKEEIFNKWNQWTTKKLSDSDLNVELESIKNLDKEIEDRFYRDLEFGTGGLRGIIGAGTNRMNIYTVAKASQGYSNFLKAREKSPSIAIAYDSRIKSDVFAKKAAEVYAANGIKVYIYPELMPTPALSFAVRYLKCSGGVVITASHNPAKYNGYKVYGSDGGQITTETANCIYKEINALDIFTDVKIIKFDEAVAQEKITYITNDVVREYIEAVSSQSLCVDEIEKKLSIVYTPLNGSGLRCVKEVLTKNGFTNISVVSEQEKPDGNFTTCPYPNPEIKETLELGLRDAKKLGSDLILATDPDCDRVGIAVRYKKEYLLLSGNEVGMLLFDYICKLRIKHHKMPKDPIMVKTIVTTDMVKKIAKNYGVQVIDVLTGFKFIGEQISLLQNNGEEQRYIFGFEESYGYLTGGYVRDKDAVNASLMICEMFAYYRHQGISLAEVLNKLYKKYGYCLNTLHSFTFERAEGSLKMKGIMNFFRYNNLEKFADLKVIDAKDYLNGINGLPKSDVLKFSLIDDSSIVIRPSGTEPKLKVYLSVNGDSMENATALEKVIIKEIDQLLYTI